MSARADVSSLLASVSLPDLISRYVALKKHGHEYSGLCPFHSERSPSFTVFEGREKERFHCMGCGVGGDAIDFVMRAHSVDFKTAIAIIGDKSDTIAPLPAKKAGSKKVQRLTRPAERADGEPNMQVYGWGDPTMSWVYRRPTGEPLFYVARYEWDDSGKRRKATPQWTMGSLDGGRSFSWGLGHYASPRPLYGLEKLAKDKNSPVLLCEGEKATDAAQRLLPHFVSMTWPGGSNATKYADFTPLHGKDVILWPDADAAVYPAEHDRAGELMPVSEQVGTACMVDIATKLQGIARSVRLVQVPVEAENAGWDAADIEAANWDTEHVANWVEERAASWSTFIAPTNAEIAANEDAMGLAFAERYGSQLRYLHDLGIWLQWDGNRWKPERTKLAFHFAREIARAANIKGEKGLAKAATASGVERHAQTDRRLATNSEAFDQNSWLLATPDGTVDLKTGLSRPALQSDMIMKITAVAPTGECPIWLEFLEQATREDGEMMDYLQRVVGYSLTGSTKEHALFFVHGPGGNGKGVFLNTITEILGDYATTAPMDMFAAAKHERHPTDVARLRGARLVAAQETEEGRSWAEVKIKSLTGGDKIAARFMGKDFFEYVPTFKLLIAGNHQPSLSTVDESMRRRFHIIPFLNKPARKDEDLPEKLRAEYPAILSWMIDGCLNWQKVGLKPPPSVVEATQEYFENQNTFASWLEECCIVDRRSRDTSANLFASWKSWAGRNGEDEKSAKLFTQDLKREGFQQIRTNSSRMIVGIEVKPKDTADQWQNRYE